jgi:hypothetical protein
MRPEILLIPVAAGALTLTGLKLRKQHQYRRLEARQPDLVVRYGAALSLPDCLPPALPDWLILGFEDMLPAAIKCPGVTPARLDRAA